MMELPARVLDAFQHVYGRPAAGLVRAPGRVNLIGEHTDYNDGFVLPMAIDRAVWIAFRPRADRTVQAHSLDFDQRNTFSLDHLGRPGQGWAEYVKGVAWALQEAGHTLGGWEGVIAGDVPVGAGLSSSAALEMAVARTFMAVGSRPWDGPAMARAGQRAESGWVGMNCGIMDQMISACGAAGHALLIDCRSLATDTVPLPPATSIVILDTATRRGLVGSAYNERRAQCEAAARQFGAPALRDVTLAQFEAAEAFLDETARRRARHVISENQRTLEAATAMRQGDAVRLGELMSASHVSLRDDFDVSSEQLNLIVDCARSEPACFGARMTGAGFGGCAVALVSANAAPAFAEAVFAHYQARSGLQANIYVCSASAGAQWLVAP